MSWVRWGCCICWQNRVTSRPNWRTRKSGLTRSTISSRFAWSRTPKRDQHLTSCCKWVVVFDKGLIRLCSESPFCVWFAVVEVHKRVVGSSEQPGEWSWISTVARFSWYVNLCEGWWRSGFEWVWKRLKVLWLNESQMKGHVSERSKWMFKWNEHFDWLFKQRNQVNNTIKRTNQTTPLIEWTKHLIKRHILMNQTFKWTVKWHIQMNSQTTPLIEWKIKWYDQMKLMNIQSNERSNEHSIKWKIKWTFKRTNQMKQSNEAIKWHIQYNQMNIQMKQSNEQSNEAIKWTFNTIKWAFIQKTPSIKQHTQTTPSIKQHNHPTPTHPTPTHPTPTQTFRKRHPKRAPKRTRSHPFEQRPIRRHWNGIFISQRTNTRTSIT